MSESPKKTVKTWFADFRTDLWKKSTQSAAGAVLLGLGTLAAAALGWGNSFFSSTVEINGLVLVLLLLLPALVMGKWMFSLFNAPKVEVETEGRDQIAQRVQSELRHQGVEQSYGEVTVLWRWDGINQNRDPGGLKLYCAEHDAALLAESEGSVRRCPKCQKAISVEPNELEAVGRSHVGPVIRKAISDECNRLDIA